MFLGLNRPERTRRITLSQGGRTSAIQQLVRLAVLERASMYLYCGLLGAILLFDLVAAQTPTTAQKHAEQANLLSEDQIRELIRESADKDAENEKKQRDYTYTEREQMRRIDAKGQVKSTESNTYDVLQIYGEQVRKLVAKNDKPLSEKDAKKEDDKIQKLIEKRQNESQADREKRLEKETKDREQGRLFVHEVADAYNFRFVGTELLDSRENYVIDAEPKPGYEPHLKEAKILPKFRFRAWIDTQELQWRKLQAECIDTVTFGLFLFRMHKGSHATIEQARVNDEVWLQQRIVANIDFRLALLKNFDIDIDINDRDYKKFRSNTTIIPLGEASTQ